MQFFSSWSFDGKPTGGPVICRANIVPYCLNNYFKTQGIGLASAALHYNKLFVIFCFRSGLCKLWSIPDCEPIAVLRGKHTMQKSIDLYFVLDLRIV